MYLPVFIAILLGFMAPNTTGSYQTPTTTTYIDFNAPITQSSASSEPDTTATGEDGTGGETGHTPPPKP